MATSMFTMGTTLLVITLCIILTCAYAAPQMFGDQQEVSVELVPAVIRTRRGDHGHHGYGYLGPVYTYAKTDYHANFKWGVRHHVGGHHGHHG